MLKPVYFKQEHQYTCSLAVLRMALASKGIHISEDELIEEIKQDYGKNFKNIWNPTVAKLATKYGLETILSADWPLLEESVLEKAILEFQQDPQNFNYLKYENKDDDDQIDESLLLAYIEVFRAREAGCSFLSEKLTAERLSDLLKAGKLIQTSVRLNLLYPGKPKTFHSILIYGFADDLVYFHDPDYGEGLSCSISTLLEAANATGAFMIYDKKWA